MKINDVVENTIHRLRYREVVRHLCPCSVLLDLGCGSTYRFLKKFHHIAQQCSGLDVTVNDGQDGNIQLRRFDATKPLPFGSDSVDLITCLAVLEHVENPTPIFLECRRVLKQGGRLIVTTPSQVGIWTHENLRRLRLVQDVEEDEHKDFGMSAAKLAGWALEAGLIVKEAKRFELGMNILLVAEKN